MTDTTTILDRFADIVADHDAAEAQKAQEQARREQAEARLAFDRETAKLTDYFPPEIMAYGWCFEPAPGRVTCTDVTHNPCRPLFALVATFLPDDVEPLRIPVDYPQYRNARTPELRLHNLGYEHPHIRQGATAAEVDAILAPIVTQHVAWARGQAEIRATQARQRADAERQTAERRQREAEQKAQRARIDAEAARLAEQAERDVDAELAALDARFGWPAGRSLTVYQLTWTEGVDAENGVHRSDPRYLMDPEPDADGFFAALGMAGMVRVRVTGTAVTTIETVWRKTSDLPYDLRESIWRARTVEIWDTAGTGCWFRSDQIGTSLVVPSPSVRALLGVDTAEIPVAQPTTIVVRDTGDGFEPFTPPAPSEKQGGADLEDLPF